ncbi:MAG: sulfite exporter TauE/SafE family protein [Tatlockia sp.]|nr:sulfite exporter TauE/SafE family protein [Tatlockia sp.]
MGIGGGIIVVPALIFLFQHNNNIAYHLIMPMAIGTSLAVMVFTAPSALRIHYKNNNIFWAVYKRLVPGLIFGTVCGALLADKLPTRLLKLLFCFFLITIALKMSLELYQKPKLRRRRFPKRWANNFMSFFIGCQSGLLGIGGGSLIIPYLSHCGLDVKKITPISVLTTMTVAFIGTLAFISIGSFQQGLPAFSSGFVYWPAALGIALTSIFFAPLGAKLTYILSAKHLRYSFIVLLIVMIIELLTTNNP